LPLFFQAAAKAVSIRFADCTEKMRIIISRCEKKWTAKKKRLATLADDETGDFTFQKAAGKIPTGL